MGFLKFLDRKKGKDSGDSLSVEHPFKILDDDRFGDDLGTRSGNLGRLRLPPLPPLDDVHGNIQDGITEDIPEEIENPFESHNSSKNSKGDGYGKLLPSLLSQSKSLESALNEGFKEASKKLTSKEIVSKSSASSAHPLENEKRHPQTNEDGFEFPDMSLVPDEFKERVEEDVRDTKSELLQAKHHDKIRGMEGPLFVNINGFNDLVVGIDSIKKALKDCDIILKNTLVMKEKQDHKLIQWQEEFEDVERKLLYCDKVLFETKHY